jgi:hypothetical protein
MTRRAPAWGLAFLIAFAPACSGNRKRTSSGPEPTGTETRSGSPGKTAEARTTGPATTPARTDVPVPLRSHLKPWHRFKQEWARTATVWFVGSYGQGSYPCVPGPGGSLDMIQQNYFRVTRVLRGKVAVKTVDVNPYPRKDETVPPYLVEGRVYLVLLKPNPASVTRLGNSKTIFNLHTLIRRTEIVAIVDLSQGKQEAEAEQVKATRTGSYGNFTFTPAKWHALRHSKTADLEKQKPFLAFIENVVIKNDSTERRLRSYLGSPDSMRRSRCGAYTCAYQLNLNAYRKPSHGAVYTELKLWFGRKGKLVQYRIEYFKWTVGKNSSSSTALSEQELKKLGLKRVKKLLVR